MPDQDSNVEDKDINTEDFDPVRFAAWRLNEFKKPQSAGVLNEGLEKIADIFREIIGDFENERKPQFSETDKYLYNEWWEYVKKLRSNNNIIFAIFVGIIGVVFLGIYYVLKVPLLIITLIDYLLGYKYKKFSAPIIIYGILVGLSISQKYTYDAYRMMWLLITYILLYTRNFNIKRLIPFIIFTIIGETMFIIYL
jgi:hypothetical protein